MLKSLFRNLCTFAVYVLAICNQIHVNCETLSVCKDSGKCAQFEALNHAPMRAFSTSESTTFNLPLIAAGMRRKSLFIIEVDVYTVALYACSTKQASLAEAKSLALLASGTTTEEESAASAAIVLRFVRGVPTSKVVDAIVEALTIPNADAAYEAELKKFSEYLLVNIGSNGMAKNDEIIFTCLAENSSGFVVSVRGLFAGIVDNEVLRKRLMDIYAGPTAVAPAVYDILSKTFLA